MDERSERGPQRCWACGYPNPFGSTRCSECGEPRTEAWERWSQATHINAFDAARAVRTLKRIRWCAVALMIACVAWILMPPAFALVVRSSMLAIVFLFIVPEIVVPWLAVLSLWPVLHGRWMRLVCWVTLSVSAIRLTAILAQERETALALTVLLAKPAAVLALTTLGILLPAGTLIVLMVAVRRLATGLRWPWRYALVVGAAGLAAVLCVGWAGAFVAANTEGLGGLQPTLTRMLQFLRFAWMISGLSSLLMSALMVGLTRALMRRLR